MSEKNDCAFGGLEQARAKYERIMELLANLKKANGTSNDKAQDEAQTAINENALSVEVKKRYVILLSWGGPATRITGDLDKYNEPETAQLQHQDWGTYWTDYKCNQDILLDYARLHYFEMEA